MERIQVRGIAHDRDIAMLTLRTMAKPGAALPQLVTRLSQAGIQVKSFFHGPAARGRIDLFFVIPAGDVARATTVLGKDQRGAAAKLTVNRELGAITLVGPGVGGEMAIISKMLATLASQRIHVEGLITGETRICGYIGRGQLERALTALHRTFIG